MRGRFPEKTTTHFGKSKINFLLVCLFMKARILASSGPAAPKGTKLPESSKPEPSFPPDPYLQNNPKEAQSQPLHRSSGPKLNYTTPF